MWFLKHGTHQADTNELVETKADCGVVAILCGQSVIIRFYTSHFGNGTARLEPQVRWYRKKYQVLYPVENLSKVSRTKPYLAVEKSHLYYYRLCIYRDSIETLVLFVKLQSELNISIIDSICFSTLCTELVKLCVTLTILTHNCNPDPDKRIILGICVSIHTLSTQILQYYTVYIFFPTPSE